MHTPSTPAQQLAWAAKHCAATPARSARHTLRLTLLRGWGLRYRRPAAAQTPIHRILVLRPDHLGDMLFATPALHALRTAFPAAHLSVLAGPWNAAVLAGNPDVDEVLTCPFPGFTRQPAANALAPYRLLHVEAQRLAAQGFDLAVVLRFDHWWGAWLTAAAGIPRRVGYAWPEVSPFLTRAVPYQTGQHEVLQNLELTDAACGQPRSALPAAWDDARRLRVAVSPEDAAAAVRLLHTIPRQPVIALHPGSGAAVKRWHPAAWAEIAAALTRRAGAQVVFTGSASEADEINAALALLPEDLAPAPISLAGQTNLGTLAALYRNCVLVIGPDSGPLHLAVAMNTPTVHLYGPVDQRTFGPWGLPGRHLTLTSNWPCIPCNRLDWPEHTLAEHGCVRDIAVADVLAAALSLLQPLASAPN